MSRRARPQRIRERVFAAAEDALLEHDVVTVVDVFERIGWLKSSRIAAWQQGRLEYLSDAIKIAPESVHAALQLLADWAEARRMDASDVEYLSQSLEPKPLRFTPPGEDPHIEAAFRARWISPHVTGKKRERLEAKQMKAPEIAVIQPLNEDDWTCGRCGKVGGRFLVMDDQTKGPMCLDCAGLGDLVFLPAGDTNLTRRTRAESARSYVVIRFNMRRKRYQRQGVLVEKSALKTARRQLSDESD